MGDGMIRLTTLFWLGLVAVVSFAMFEVKYAVMDLEDQLAKVNRAIVADDDAIHVLKAEWSYLAQPSRLDDLSHRFLALGPIGTAQLGTIESIKMRPVPPVVADAAPGTGPGTTLGAAKPGSKPATPALQTTAPAPQTTAPTRLANAKLRIDR
jgi:hypothetical protein